MSAKACNEIFTVSTKVILFIRYITFKAMYTSTSIKVTYETTFYSSLYWMSANILNASVGDEDALRTEMTFGSEVRKFE
jgi:hypothetical protein